MVDVWPLQRITKYRLTGFRSLLAGENFQREPDLLFLDVPGDDAELDIWRKNRSLIDDSLLFWSSTLDVQHFRGCPYKLLLLNGPMFDVKVRRFNVTVIKLKTRRLGSRKW